MHPVGAAGGPAVAGIPVEFLLFAIVLGMVAFSHASTLATALWGALAITLYKVGFSGYAEGAGAAGLAGHLRAEWVGLANLLALLLGFALLARHFERSGVPARLPDYLPDGWGGPLVLLFAVFFLSSFLDNIAAAMIGGTVAHSVFRGKVHIGYLAAIVAASNAGGSGSVVGDTTTTMMWLAGVPAAQVFPAYVGAVAALVVCAVPASLAQHAHCPILKDAPAGAAIDWTRVAIVALILAAAVGANLLLNLRFREWSARAPFLGLALWAAILATAALRRPDWDLLPGAAKGAAFLLALVWAASSMPVEALPAASWPSALALGFVSAVFDNIPLTALALRQGGFDWGFLAYAVGFGGSMLWFGSSAGVALCSLYPQARSVTLWVRHGWTVMVAYVAGFFVMLALLGWHPGRATGIMAG
jgi:Na+/H+ antiporter NhaD/arsenite permease-like protein